MTINELTIRNSIAEVENRLGKGRRGRWVVMGKLYRMFKASRSRILTTFTKITLTIPVNSDCVLLWHVISGVPIVQVNQITGI